MVFGFFTNAFLTLISFVLMMLVAFLIYQKQMQQKRDFIAQQGWTLDSKTSVGPPQGFGFESLNLICFADRRSSKWGLRPIRSSWIVSGEYKSYDFVFCNTSVKGNAENATQVLCLLNQSTMPRFEFRSKTTMSQIDDALGSISQLNPDKTVELNFKDTRFDDFVTVYGDNTSHSFFDDLKRSHLAARMVLLSGREQYYKFGASGSVFYLEGEILKPEDYKTQLDLAIEFAELIQA